MNDARRSRPRVEVRRAGPEDLAAVVAVEETSFSSPWPASLLARDLADPEVTPYWVALAEGAVIGYLGGWRLGEEFHVASVATALAWRRRGVGELMMLTALSWAGHHGAQSAWLEYRVSNLPAERLYRKLGFRPVRLRRGYYADTGEDAREVVLEGLDLPPTRARLAEWLAAWPEAHD